MLVGTLLVELAIYLCYRHCCFKSCSKITSSDSDVSSVEGLPQPKDYHAASWSYRGGPKPKEKADKAKKTEVYNISESKTEEDKVMFSPGLYRTSLEPKGKGRNNIIVNGADNYVPEFPTIYSYNSAWDNSVDQILSKHGRYDGDDNSFVSIDLDDDQEYPILKAPKDGVGSIDFSSAKFGLHNRGFVPDNISLNESDNGGASTYRYFTGINGKPEMIPMEELDHHHRRAKEPPTLEYPILRAPKDGVGNVDFSNAKFGLHNHGFVPDNISLSDSDNGSVSTYRYFTGISGKPGHSVSHENTVIDMEWDDYTDPDTRINIDDNFMIGAPSVSTIAGSDDVAEHRYEQDVDLTGNFILRTKPDQSVVRSDSSDEDLYDYGDSDSERKTLAQKHGPWTSTFTRATYKAKMGEVSLDRDLPSDDSEMPEFGERYRYSTGLRRAKFTAMRAAAAPTSRENDKISRRQHEEAVIKRHQEQSLSQERPQSPDPVIGYIKLIRPDVHERAPSPEPTQGRSTAPILGHIKLARPEVFDKAMYQDTHFRLAPTPGQDEDDDDLMVLYPIPKSKDAICRRCRRGDMDKDTKDSASQASIELVNASTISETQSGRRKKKDNGVETIGKCSIKDYTLWLHKVNNLHRRPFGSQGSKGKYSRL